MSFNVYFADRRFNIMGIASTEMKTDMRIVDDLETGDIESGSVSLELTIAYKDITTANAALAIGNYLLYKNENGVARYMTVVRRDNHAASRTCELYAEDAGLDLLGEIALPYAADKAYPIEHYINRWTVDTGFTIGINEISSLSRKLAWTGEETFTKRLLSVATQFDNAEIGFSFEFKGMQVVGKYIDIYKKRSRETGVTLQLGRDVNEITTTESIENLATGLIVTGGTPEGQDAPITLKGYKYDDGRFFVSAGGYVLDRESNARWSRYLAPTETGKDAGYILKTFSYDTLSQSELCNRAIGNLTKISQVEQNFEVDIAVLPENCRLGDVVNIVDHTGELYLEARILSLEVSRSSKKNTAVLGEFLIKDSGIDLKLQEIADKIAANKGADGQTTYFHTAYANSADGTVDFSTTDGKGKAYLGTSSGFDVEAPTDPAEYTWQKVKGEDGATGKSSYVHSMYSNSINFGNHDYSGNPNLMLNVDYSKLSSNLNQIVPLNAQQVIDKGDYFEIDITDLAADGSATVWIPYITRLITDQSYNFSVEMKTETGTFTGIQIRPVYHNDKQIVSALFDTISNTATDTWTRYDKTFTPTLSVMQNSSISAFQIYLPPSATRGKLHIRYNIKIEKGSSATPYQPNLLEDPFYLSSKPLGANIANSSVVFPIITSDYKIYGAQIQENWQAGQTYTVSLKGTKPSTQSFNGYLNSGTIGIGALTPVEGKTDVWQKTFTVTQAHIDAGVTNILSFYQVPNTSTGAVQIEWLKLEKGDTATPNIDSLRYIGFYSGQLEQAPASPSVYQWSVTKGADGTGIQETTVDYQVSQNPVTPPVGTWVTEIPQVMPSQYLWTRIRLTMTDGTVTTSYSVGSMGTNGRTTHMHNAWANSEDGTLDFSTTESLNKRYLGMYADFEEEASQDPAKYSWVELSSAYPKVYVQDLAPNSPNEGDQWWKMTNNVVSNYYVYGDEQWNEQTIDQSILRIKELNAITVNGASIAGSEFINTWDYFETDHWHNVGMTTLRDRKIFQSNQLFLYNMEDDNVSDGALSNVTAVNIQDGQLTTSTTQIDPATGLDEFHSNVNLGGQGISLLYEDPTGTYTGTLTAKAVTKTPWVTIQLADGFEVAENNPPQYKIIYQLDGSRIVKFRGQFQLKGGTKFTKGSSYYPFGRANQAVNIPAVIRPDRTEFGYGATSTGVGGRVAITTAPTFIFIPGDSDSTYCAISPLTYIQE